LSLKKEVEIPKDDKFIRPKVMQGRTLKTKLLQNSLYVTLNYAEDGSPKEVFVTLGKHGGDENADAEAIGRLISIYLQRGGMVEDVVKSMKGIKGRYVSWDEGKQILSIPDAVAKSLERIITGNITKAPSEDPVVFASYLTERVTKAIPVTKAVGDMCPDCQENAVIHENGCLKCTNCGYSRCD
jgi:ribonucleoside-diphosphate reductase alpha chain